MERPGKPAGAAGTEPRQEYERRLAARREELARAERLDRRIADLRLAALAAALLLAGAGILTGTPDPAWGAVPGAGFVALVLGHERVRRRRERLDSAVRLYERCIARLDDAWAGTGRDGAGLLDPRHPYAADLDIFGRGSLFQLLCTTRTSTGAATLAGWLGSAASAPVVRARQEAVVELRDRLDLREELALAGERIESSLHPARLVAWATDDPAPLPRRTRTACAAASVATTATLAAWALTPVGPLPALVAVTLHAILLRVIRDPVRRVVEAAGAMESELPLLASVTSRLERESFASRIASGVRERLAEGDVCASAILGRLSRQIALMEQRRNQYFAPIAGLLCWSAQLAVSTERWRAEHGRRLGEWLEAIGEMEALCSLASYAYERPADPLPEIVDEGPAFEATGLAHPLLPESVAVRNDVRLGGDARLLMVSGSNMSGKSTLLRSVGVNAVLALAGAPVRAESLRISALDIGAVLVIHDSLRRGRSRFMTEIERVRDLVVRASASGSVMFLLDELLAGTNSRDRRIGAAALLRRLIEAGAIGIVTTHDLALAEIADELAPAASNAHFEDRLQGEELVFDYRLRPGVVSGGNALALMRSIGLDV